MRIIILASGSPRRRDLFEQMGLTFQVMPSDFSEYLDDSRSAVDLTIELGLGKARAVAAKHPEAIVIGSDTIVTLNGRHLGKAETVDEARAVLRAHAGQTVTVTTSLVVICKQISLEEALADETKVVFKPLNETAIETYLQTNDWQDKAGSWGIQSGAAPLIDHIKGAYDTILGLPTTPLAAILRRFDIPAHSVLLKPPVPNV